MSSQENFPEYSRALQILYRTQELTLVPFCFYEMTLATLELVWNKRKEELELVNFQLEKPFSKVMSFCKFLETRSDNVTHTAKLILDIGSCLQRMRKGRMP